MEVFVKKYIRLSAFMVALVLSACGSGSADDPTSVPTEVGTDSAPALPTIAPITPEPGYPGPLLPDAYPPPPTPPEATGYPAPPLATPTPYSYPEGTTFWMRHPAGLQCEEPLIYPLLADAVAALENSGVAVLNSEDVNMMVCEACGCPTSQQYRVQIGANDLESATMLGWIRE